MPWADRVLLFEALIRLGAARVFVLISGRTVLSRLGPQTETSNHDDPEASNIVERIRWSLSAVSRRVPWRCECLEQAIAARWMLGSRGYATTLYLGVAGRDAIEGHAWLRCGSLIVTGGTGEGRFAVMSKFGDS